MSFIVIIPARYQSSRFPGKPLANIKGKPMIWHVCERAKEAGAAKIIVATDHDEIAQNVPSYAQVCMTGEHHTSGTERIAEVIDLLNIPKDTIVVNVQGDEPFVPAENIRQVAQNLSARPEFSMATLSTPIEDREEVLNPNAVKVLASNSGRAIYFSRSVIPFERSVMMQSPIEVNCERYQRHIGIYAYRAAYVKTYVDYKPSELESIESLEQLRAIWYDDLIHVEVAHAPPPIGIDTPEDLQRLLSAS